MVYQAVILKNKAYSTVSVGIPGMVGEKINILSLEKDLTAGRFGKSRNNIEEGSFSGAAFAEDRYKLFGPESQIHLLQHDMSLMFDIEILTYTDKL